jgi:hypothetical protein
MGIPAEIVEFVLMGLVAFGAVKTAVRVLEQKVAALEADVRRLENKVFNTSG